jgi:hypothetical protein
VLAPFIQAKADRLRPYHCAISFAGPNGGEVLCLLLFLRDVDLKIRTESKYLITAGYVITRFRQKSAPSEPTSEISKFMKKS